MIIMSIIIVIFWKLLDFMKQSNSKFLKFSKGFIIYIAFFLLLLIEQFRDFRKSKRANISFIIAWLR